MGFQPMSGMSILRLSLRTNLAHELNVHGQDARATTVVPRFSPR